VYLFVFGPLLLPVRYGVVEQFDYASQYTVEVETTPATPR
jgi:hypothetical protein